MNRSRKISTRSAQKWSVAFCLSLVLFGFSGCSTVQPELTPEERSYNKQLNQQGKAEASPTTEMNLGQKVVHYLSTPIQVIGYAFASSGGNADHP